MEHAAALNPLVVGSIGTTDPWNAAGLGLDLRLLAHLGVRGVTVVTGVSAQGPGGLARLHPVDAATVLAQFAALGESGVAAWRIGALGPDTAAAVAEGLARFPGLPVILDPVLSASAGGAFGDPRPLLPLVDLITPNAPEAASLTGLPVRTTQEMIVAAQRLRERDGVRAVVVTGGHLPGEEIVDVLVWEGGVERYQGPRFPREMRGTGCVFAIALTVARARGAALPLAVERARVAVRDAIAGATPWSSMHVAAP